VKAGKGAEWAIACGGRYRKREPIDVHNVPITIRAKLLALYERALTAVGSGLGEELIVVLKKPN
jgi:hypothetical protein